MHRNLSFVALAATLFAATAARGVDVLIPGKVGVVKPAKIAKLVSKQTTPLLLPTAGSANDPTLHGAQVQIFDTMLGGGGSFTHNLDKTGWKGLGNPAGTKGYKYVGKKASPVDSVCKVVLIKPTHAGGKVKVRCKGAAVTLTTPFLGLDGVIIGIPAGTAPALRYCAALGGTTKKNTVKELKRKDAPAPGSCPFVGATPTATNTPVSTATATRTSTATNTNTPGNTNTPANTATVTQTRTATGTATITNTPGATFTSTATRTNSPTPTNTPIVCPLAAPNRYTQTTTGGVLKVATFASFAFPAGGVTVQDVGAGNAQCVHQTVVPFPGGFTTPNFCVPALGATTSVTQSGCGVGEIDSNGGSDFTVNENGDTSEETVCGVPTHQTVCPGAGPAPDSSGRLDIKVGDGVTDVCTGGGTANAIVTIPVNTLTWVAADSSCPDTDGTFNPGTDTQLAKFPQTLDLTTDTAVAKFTDLGTSAPDPDGCTKSGLGPASYTGVGPNGANGFCQGAGVPSACCTGVNTGTCTGPTGKCLNIGGMTVNVAAAGTIFSSGGPTYDLLFTTVQNSTVSGPAAFGGATCGSPPVINFTGTATRCLFGP